MSGARPVPFPESRQAAAGRLRLMLAASALLHLLFAEGLVSDAPWGKTPAGTAAPITARLEPLPAMESANPVLPEPSPIAPRSKQPAPLAEHESRVAADTGAPSTRNAPLLALPQAPDSTYYAARDLDTYPRPVAPLELDRFATGVAASDRVRFALLIDERGTVNDVTPVESGPPGAVDERLRAVLAAARFVPAYKDGRAVKSRLVLSINSGISDR